MSSNAVCAGRRARFLADIVRERATLRPEIDAYLEIARHLDTASVVLDRDEPPVLDGIALVDVMPGEATAALWDVARLAETLGAHHFPLPLLDYITEPLGGRLPELEPVGRAGSQLADQAADIRGRLARAERHIDWDNDAIMHDTLGNLFKLHVMYVRLVESATVQAARP